jgi:hypothetical protein
VLELAVREAVPDRPGAAGGGWAGGGQVTPETTALLERYAAARPVDPFPHRVLANLYLNGPNPNPDIACWP